MYITTIVDYEDCEMLWVAFAYSKESVYQQVKQILWKYTASEKDEEIYLHAIKNWAKGNDDDLCIGDIIELNVTYINKNIDTSRTLCQFKY